jgi:hypothetical protein
MRVKAYTDELILRILNRAVIEGAFKSPPEISFIDAMFKGRWHKYNLRIHGLSYIENSYNCNWLNSCKEKAAQPGGKPHDTLARQAQVAWFSSGFIWQKR